jgi:hypothetical protein
LLTPPHNKPLNIPADIRRKNSAHVAAVHERAPSERRNSSTLDPVDPRNRRKRLDVIFGQPKSKYGAARRAVI